jgi:hypothetical protein
MKQTEARMGFSKRKNTMKGQAYTVLIAPLLLALSSECQVVNTGTETRMEEQMLKVSFENAQSEELFAKIIYGTDQETHVKKRVGTPSVSLYSRTETVAFNAHCNDHIRAMDKNSDLVISQKEAEEYYRVLSEQGKITSRE